MNYVVNSGQLVCYKKRPSSRASDRMTVDNLSLAHELAGLIST